MWAAVRRRMDENGMTSSVSAGGGESARGGEAVVGPEPGGAGSGARDGPPDGGGGAWARAWARTSAAVRRPPAPVASTSEGSRSCSSSNRRTTGERKVADPVARAGRLGAGASSRTSTTASAAAGSSTAAGGPSAGSGPESALVVRSVLATVSEPAAPSVAGALGAVADPGQRGADRDRVALGDEDLTEDACRSGRDLGVDLVGRDLEERFVDRDPSPMVFSQRVTVPSVTVSPSWGMLIVAMAVPPCRSSYRPPRTTERPVGIVG